MSPHPPRSSTRRLRLTAFGAVMAMVVAMLTTLFVAPSAQASPSSVSAEDVFVSSINDARHDAGRSELSTSSSLTAVARAWAGSLASSGQLAHNPRVTSQVKGWRYLGENVGVGDTADSLHQAFMDSAPHRANVLSTRYTRVGVGVAFGQGRMWVVEVFDQPQKSSRTTTTKAAKKASTVHTYGYGSRGTTVKKAQRKLHVQADGIFGKITLSKVRAYQKSHKLHVTGKLDAVTRKHLKV